MRIQGTIVLVLLGVACRGLEGPPSRAGRQSAMSAATGASNADLSTVRKAIRAAEIGDRASFDAQVFNEQHRQARPQMESLVLGTNCSLLAVSALSDDFVKAQWTCLGGDRPVKVDRTFVLTGDKIRSIIEGPELK